MAAVDAGAAIYAGVAAGILATVVQIVLWAIFTDAMPATLYRDSRFAAAIVLDGGVLPPPASFEVRITLLAAVVHFALAIFYALLLARLIADLRMRTSLLAGAAFGLCVYALNMYGFTAVFPWFAPSRDWIAAVSLRPTTAQVLPTCDSAKGRLFRASATGQDSTNAKVGKERFDASVAALGSPVIGDIARIRRRCRRHSGRRSGHRPVRIRRKSRTVHCDADQRCLVRSR